MARGVTRAPRFYSRQGQRVGNHRTLTSTAAHARRLRRDVTYHVANAVSYHNSPVRACGGRFTVRQCDFGTFAAPEGAYHVCLMLLVCRVPNVCCEL